MSSATQTEATIEDLYRFDGKAELIDGRIVPLMGAGHRHNQIAGTVYRGLFDYAVTSGEGVAYTDNMTFIVPRLASGRLSFSPDAAYYTGPLPDDEADFAPGPPTFAVEVRSKGDRESEMAAKRADYFEAGTLVVWDVDPIAATIAVYRSDTPDQPTIFARGEVANAEPAAPGWRLAVDALFA